MFLKTNLQNNILSQYAINDYGNNHEWNPINKYFGGGGTNINSIPALDSIYNASKWSMWGTKLSYLNSTNNWVDLPEGTVSYSFTELLLSPICFPAGTPIITDQGEISIDKINNKINTIRGNKIIAVTKSIPLQKHIVCITKNALYNNIPSKTTYISLNHELLYKGKMVKAKELVNKIDGVYFKKYNNEILYNILLEKHDKMIVNNLIVETLNPKNIVAKLYNKNLPNKEKNNIIIKLNSIIKNNNYEEYKKLCNSL